jgi:CRISPR-associated protein Cas1
VRIAVVAAGLDPTIGLLHASRPGRVAFVYDLMEPLRPQADQKLLKFLLSRKFLPGDFSVTASGVCRLHPQLAKAVAALTVEQAPVRDMVDRIIVSLLEAL